MAQRERARQAARAVASVALGLAVALAAVPGRAATLDEVKARGLVICGASLGLPGFSIKGPDGRWRGLDVDVCRAVAAAALGDAEKVKFVALSTKERFTALRSGDVDLLVRNTTWTLARDTAMGVNFAGVNYYDGQGFMVRKDLGLKSAEELGGATVCVEIATTTELNLADFFRTRKLTYRQLDFDDIEKLVDAYEGRSCDAFAADRSALAARRMFMRAPGAHQILPETISKEPLGPAVRQGDDQWLELVRWVLNAMKEAEESGITSRNVDKMRGSTNPVVRRLLGIDGKMGEMLGVGSDWGYDVIKQVGNYAESYDRNLGPDTPIDLPRGLNRLWKDGGLHYALPIR